MCLNPISIYNPSKYINLKHGDPFRLVVPCGDCAECQTLKRNEWHFRMHWQFKSHVQNGGYVLFDTLTYKPEFRPKVSDFIETPVDYPCFSRKNVRDFIVRLRRRFSYHKYPEFTYFVSSEYGVDDMYQHCPHHHILLFVKDIDPELLSKWVYECWSLGRTDYIAAIKDFGMSYIHGHVFDDYSLHGMRLANYVAKYVQKDSTFVPQIYKRIEDILDKRFPDSDPVSVVERHSMRLKLRNLMCQFHLQSHGFGLQYLDSPDFDLEKSVITGQFDYITPDNPDIFRTIPIPMYYQRHLFQRQVEINGKRYWELNDLGVKFRKNSEHRKFDYFVRHVSDWLLNVAGRFDAKTLDLINTVFDGVDIPDLADYVLFMRGRYLSRVDYMPLSKKIEDIDFYHYGSNNDSIQYGKKFVSPIYLGNDVEGYDMFAKDDSLFPEYSLFPLDDFGLPMRIYSRFEFANSFTYIDSRLEYVYQVYLNANLCLRYKQSAFDLVQRLEKLYKKMFARL